MARVVIPYDVQEARFIAEYPAHLEPQMPPAEYDECIARINAVASATGSKVFWQYTTRVSILSILGLSVLLLLFLLLSTLGSLYIFVVPCGVLPVVVVGGVAYAVRSKAHTVTYKAVSATEPTLQELNIKHAHRGLVWRLHKIHTPTADGGEDEFDMDLYIPGKHTYWIEIEVEEEPAPLVGYTKSVHFEKTPSLAPTEVRKERSSDIVVEVRQSTVDMDSEEQYGRQDIYGIGF